MIERQETEKAEKMDELTKAEQKLQQAKSKVQRLRAKARTQERKNDARRKILLGGLLIKKCRTDPDIRAMAVTWISELSDRDVSVFEAWGWGDE
jgi:chromosome segregation ATPase